jgi:8-oxo-dGTP diphosphatase
MEISGKSGNWGWKGRTRFIECFAGRWSAIHGKVKVLMANEDQPLVRLVAAVIEREGRYLITQRRASAVLPGLWEFPGGRVEQGESDEDALRRELLERLGTKVEVKNRIAHRVHNYRGYSVDLNLFQAAILPGQEPQALRVAEVRWVPSSEFEKYPFPAADQATTDLLLGFRR